MTSKYETELEAWRCGELRRREANLCVKYRPDLMGEASNFSAWVRARKRKLTLLNRTEPCDKKDSEQIYETEEYTTIKGNAFQDDENKLSLY